MKSNYVTLEVAQLFKQSGYVLNSDKAYVLKSIGNIVKGKLYSFQYLLNLNYPLNNICTAPTLWEAAKWLREEHNIHVDVGVAGDSSNDADGNVCEEWTFWMFDIYTIDPLHHFDVEDNREYSSYEEALNEGIKVALTSLN